MFLIAAFVLTPRGGAFPAIRSELRTRAALLLEALALRRQIAVPKRNRIRRPCFRRIERLFWTWLRAGDQIGATV